MSLKKINNKKINSLTVRQCLLPFGKIQSTQKEETPLYTPALQASFTVEAAVVLPVFIYMMATLLFFFRIMEVSLEVEYALHGTVQEMALLAHYQDSIDYGFGLAESQAILWNKLRDSERVNTCVTGKRFGISLVESEYSRECIQLSAIYQVKLPFAIFGRGSIMLRQQAAMHPWTGASQTGDSVQYVYVTETGTVYHLTTSCPYLDLTIRPVKYSLIAALRNQSGRIYQQCEECEKDIGDNDTVYITDYGTCYHTGLNCSSLKRTIIRIPVTEIGERSLCTKCENINSK